MIRLYLLPIIHIDLGGGSSYNVPKYLYHRENPTPPLAGLEDVKWAWETYLLEDIGLIVIDVTTAQHTILSGQLDVLSVPGLDNVISNASVRNKVRAVLEDVHIPGGWVNKGMTYREVMRVVLHIFQFHNRFVALIQGRVFDGSLNLDMTVADIPQAKRDKLQAAADTFGLDTSAVTGTTTIRQLLKGMADQFADIPYKISGSGLSLEI